MKQDLYKQLSDLGKLSNTTKINGSVARYLAMFVAVAFFVVAVLYSGLLLSPQQSGGVAFQQVSLVGAYIVGASLLFAGAILWYKRKSWLLRLTGFVLLFIFTVYNISFAFLLIPLLLLASFSLRKHERGESRRPYRIVSGDILIVIGAIWLLLSTFLPWYSWVFHDSPTSSHNVLISLWGASPFLATAILVAAVVVVGILTLRLIGILGAGSETFKKRTWEDFLVFAAVVLAAGSTFFRMIVQPAGEGVISTGISVGFLFALMGVSILVFGAVIKLLEKRPVVQVMENLK